MKIVRIVGILTFLLAISQLSACDDKPTELVKNDSIKENPLMQGLSEIEEEQLRKILASIPIPFAIIKKVNGSGLPYKKELLNPDSNAPNYNTAEGQAVNIGVYGADMAYIIAFERLGESGPYLKSVRQLADAIVIPTIFDEKSLQKYQVQSNKQDSLQELMYESYTKIDSTLQSNERFGLAALVVSGGWIESLYLTSQQLNNEPKSDKNCLLYDMLDEQQLHTDHVISMLSIFPNDSLFLDLHAQISELKKLSSPAKEYTPEELAKVTAQLAAIRAKLVSIE